jgi:hypothetical protein
MYDKYKSYKMIFAALGFILYPCLHHLLYLCHI